MTDVTALPFDMPSVEESRPTVTFDLSALVHNWQAVRSFAGGAETGAVVKADAYGCGAGPVGRVLIQAGCRTFFVANPAEGAALRPHVGDAAIYIFAGLSATTLTTYAQADLRPILNSPAELELWKAKGGALAPIGLFIDTGMTRLGFSAEEVRVLAGSNTALAGLGPMMVMSHLACADNFSDPKNEQQLNLFSELSSLLPAHSRSLANSDGILLGAPYHFDLVRPGLALYGGSDALTAQLGLEPVAYLHAPILQVHEAPKNTCIGYGATYKVARDSRIAVVGLGYADGFRRGMSNAGIGWLAGREVPVAGRVSMDLTTFDVTDVAPEKAQAGDWIELLGSHLSVDRVGKLGGTLGYEVLTSLGARYTKRYVIDGNLVSGDEL
ncbi:MAG: alanine racemase [Alphaproteobacteria bacterium]|nr:MAG: alanine racemase [Alphaproteobacteria bacterium]